VHLSSLLEYLIELNESFKGEADPEVLILDEEGNVFDLCEGESTKDTLEVDKNAERMVLKIQFSDFTTEDAEAAGLLE
jgi:signal transduction histidine kinase